MLLRFLDPIYGFRPVRHSQKSVDQENRDTIAVGPSRSVQRGRGVFGGGESVSSHTKGDHGVGCLLRAS